MKSPHAVSVVLLILISTSLAKPSPLLPDHKLTPGVASNQSAKTLCAKSFHTRDERSVSEKTKNLVYAEYGIKSRKPHEYEVDHLISLELGGKNDIKNLWPQSYVSKPWNAHFKDQLETRLHWMICHKRISLQQAQREIASDWIASYKKHISSKPRAKLPPPETSAH
jgi:hypothetical protein